MANTSVHQALNECILERDALAESHGVLVAALDRTAKLVHNVATGAEWGTFEECEHPTCVHNRAALTKARALAT